MKLKDQKLVKKKQKHRNVIFHFNIPIWLSNQNLNDTGLLQLFAKDQFNCMYGCHQSYHLRMPTESHSPTQLTMAHPLKGTRIPGTGRETLSEGI